MFFSVYYCILLCVPSFTLSLLKNVGFMECTTKTTKLFSQKKYYPFSRKFQKGYIYLNRLEKEKQNNILTPPPQTPPQTPIKTNKNVENYEYDDFNNNFDDFDDDFDYIEKLLRGFSSVSSNKKKINIFRNINNNENDENDENAKKHDEDDDVIDSFEKVKHKRNKKSENFEVITKFPITFKDIGGYEPIKAELLQCVDILSNYKKYSKYNVRIPKGLIFEGPPGNGKTLFAKALAGESKIGFISVSGSEFNEKYVGVGASRVRELFQLAKNNAPCIIFIDEIDALGRKRSSDGEQSTAEKDTTLNELLIALDGFKNSSGVFLVGATNRVDLLDPALIRPGRIDKHIYIGNPDTITRKHVLDIHIRGKPHNNFTINIQDLTELTNGFSCSQIENLLNEALLFALLNNRDSIEKTDIDFVLNKIISGYMASPHKFNKDLMYKIVIHEMGHVICGLMATEHSKISKVVVNLFSPNSPAYTVFENGGDGSGNIYTKQSLNEHLVILLAGRVAEELIFGLSITTGAINDFEEALKLAQKMIVYYGMGDNLIYPQYSDAYKKRVDDEVFILLENAYTTARIIIEKYRDFILKGAEILNEKQIIRYDELIDLLQLYK